MTALKGWKQGKQIELTNSAQITAWRERLDTEHKSQRVKQAKEIDKLKDKLDSKNSYLHQFKKEEIKRSETVQEASAVTVRILLLLHHAYSSYSIKQWGRASARSLRTTARSVSGRAGGVLTEKKGRSSKLRMKPLSPRIKIITLIQNYRT